MILLIIYGIFPLKLKSDTFTTLSNFFVYVSTQFDRTVKAIQCDNGREFVNSSTRIFLPSNGTQHQMSCPYTSPQNGKAERIIRSVNNVIRTLLIQVPFPGGGRTSHCYVPVKPSSDDGDSSRMSSPCPIWFRALL
jgi:hypothetical protein